MLTLVSKKCENGTSVSPAVPTTKDAFPVSPVRTLQQCSATSNIHPDGATGGEAQVGLMRAGGSGMGRRERDGGSGPEGAGRELTHSLTAA